MKRFCFFLITILLLLPASVSHSFAHPGSTDEQGGHYDRSTGEYHFHHGYPAHQHEGGTCPYNFDNKTGVNSGPSSGSKSSSERYTESWTEPTTGMETTRPVSYDTPFVTSAVRVAKNNDFPESVKNAIFGVTFAFIIGALIYSVIRQRHEP